MTIYYQKCKYNDFFNDFKNLKLDGMYAGGKQEDTKICFGSWSGSFDSLLSNT